MMIWLAKEKSVLRANGKVERMFRLVESYSTFELNPIKILYKLKLENQPEGCQDG